MKAYSVDLRERIVAAVERGMPRAQVAETFGVSLSTIKRLVTRRRQDPEADLAPKRPPGRPLSISTQQQQTLKTQLEHKPDATIEQHTKRYNQEQGTSLSQWTVGRAIRRLGWTRKKNSGSHRAG